MATSFIFNRVNINGIPCIESQSVSTSATAVTFTFNPHEARRFHAPATISFSILPEGEIMITLSPFSKNGGNISFSMSIVLKKEENMSSLPSIYIIRCCLNHCCAHDVDGHCADGRHGDYHDDHRGGSHHGPHDEGDLRGEDAQGAPDNLQVLATIHGEKV